MIFSIRQMSFRRIITLPETVHAVGRCFEHKKITFKDYNSLKITKIKKDEINCKKC